MKTKRDPEQLAQELQVPADIVHIILPLLCWGLLALRWWSGLLMVRPWILILYYALAVAYLVFAFIVRMRVISIVGLFLLLAGSLFMWMPYHWVLAILLIPALFMAFYNRRNKDRVIKRPDPLTQKLRAPADIVHIALPLLCWGLVVFRWNGLWLARPWLVGVTLFYYALAAAYLVFAFIVRMRVISIVGLFALFPACLFIWLPYHWVLTILLVAAVFMAFFKWERQAAAVILTTLTAIIVSIVLVFSRFVGGTLTPEKYAYHMSPDSRYVALEYAFTQIPGGTDVLLCHAYGPLLVEERVLYLANYSDFGGDIEWLDDSTILIYGDKMDVFKDPEIKNYDYF